MRFVVLGSIEAHLDGEAVELGVGRQRAVLALLLLHAGEVVSIDRLVDGLWGEHPPPSAAKVVQGHVSALRRVVPEGTIVTRGSGYSLRADETDALEFARLVEEARDQEPQVAVRTLEGALALWRGRPYAEVEYEPWAQAEISRLEELRLAAIEERIDAYLQLGEAARVVPELEALAGKHPLRERVQALLTLALYQSGRQAEALEVYAGTRRRLVDELGIEPGPELQDLQRRILAHDPDLGSVHRRRPPVRAARLPLWLVAAGGILLAAAVAAGAILITAGGNGGIHVLAGGSVGAIDPRTRRIVAQLPLAGGPARMTQSGTTFWVGSDRSETLARVDAHEPAVEGLVAPGGFPSALAFGEGALWIADGRKGTLTKVDPAYGSIVGRLRFAAPNAAYDVSRRSVDPISVASGMGSVWLTDGSRTLTRVDPLDPRIRQRISLPAALDDVAVGEGAVWAISGPAATLYRIDPHTGSVTTHIPVASTPGFASPYPLAVGVGEGWIWVLNGNSATVTKIDPRERTVSATVPVGIEHGPLRLAVGVGAAWVANLDGSLSRIDAQSNAVSTSAVSHGLADVAVAGGRVWVTAATGFGTAVGVTPGATSSKVSPLPTSSCSPIYAEGKPDYLIASDLPLQGADRNLTSQAAEAIEFVLRQHGFRAGRYAVGYQSCDDATAEAGYASPARCAANARAYAADRSVLGVLGTYNSFCAEIEVPIAGRARGGPLAVISGANTVIGLTHAGPGALPGEPGRYYPTGARNYARVSAADDVQGAADAMLAKYLGAHVVYALAESDPYGDGLAASFERTARSLGLRVAGTGSWHWDRPQPKQLAAEALRSGADTVLIALGVIDVSELPLIETLHAAGIRILGTDGFSDFPELVRIFRAAAEGMRVTIPGLPIERLPPVGRSFAAAFGNAVGQAPNQGSIYWAQATEVLLDAIARSDGTRASVRSRVFATHIVDGLIGSISFDRNGDTTTTAVTAYRVAGGIARIERVITPPRRLFRRS